MMKKNEGFSEIAVNQAEVRSDAIGKEHEAPIYPWFDKVKISLKSS